MAKPDPDLDRLLRAAAAAQETNSEPASIPFGFDTRVVALARAQTRGGQSNGGRELARFLRRVALVAVVITAFASSAAYWQVSENEAIGEPLSNAYAFADNAIESEFFE
jgi:hypothetical protein